MNTIQYKKLKKTIKKDLNSAMKTMLRLILLLCCVIVAPIGLAQAQIKPGCEAAALYNPQGSYTGSFSNQPFTWAKNAAQWICVMSWSGTSQSLEFMKWYDAAAVCDETTCTVTPENNFSPGDHWWWLDTYSDTCGYQMQQGGLSLQFHVTACSAPALTEPTGAITTIHPTFKWGATSAQWINLLVFSEASGSLVFSQWFDALQLCSDTTCTVQPDMALYPGKHWWWLNTYSAACGFQMQPGGAVNEFTVQSCTNAAITLTDPLQGALRTSTPSFTWQKNTDFDNYQINVYSTATGTIYFHQLYPESQICNGTSCTVTMPAETPLPEGDTWWWLNASGPDCGWKDVPGGQYGNFNVVPASAKNITSFVFKAADNPGLSADMAGVISDNAVDLLVPYGANLAALKPTITTIVGSSINPPSGSAQAFTDGVAKTYTVTASDGSTKNYAVTTTVITVSLTDPLDGALRTRTPSFSWKKNSYFDYYQLNVYPVSTSTIYFRQLYTASQICTGTSCTVTIPDETPLPEGGTYWWLNAAGPNCGWQDIPGGQFGYFTVVPASAKDITSFVFRAADNPQLPSDITGAITVDTVHLTVPFGTNLSALMPTITTIVGSSINPPSGSAQAFTDNVSKIYTVTAADSSTKQYAVTVTVAPDPTTKDITSFILSVAANPDLPTDITGTVGASTVDLTVPYGTNLSALVPTITITGSRINPASGVAQAFTNGIGTIYTVTAADNSTKEYTVTVTALLSPAKDITSFVFRAANNPGLASDITGTVGASTVDLTVPYGTNLSALMPAITITGSSVTPSSGLAQAFTDGVAKTYTVTAANSTTKTYAVTVHVALNPAKDITSFVFRTANNLGLSSDITGTIGTNTVDLTVPYGSNLSALVPTITITGSSVNPASGAAQAFTNAVTYTVTAADSTTKTYTVTVHVALNPAKDITSFVFRAANNPGLASDITGTVGTNTVDLTVPYGTNLSALVPTITITGSSVNPASGAAQAFTNGVTYTVTAADSTTKVYTVTVHVALNSAKDITSFIFLKANNSGLASDVPGVFGSNTITLTVPYGTSLTGLIPTITITGASVNPASGVAQTFTNGVGKTYTVIAADGTTKNYTVTVTVDASNTDKDITSFIFRAFDNPGLTADVVGTIGTTTVALTVPYGTNLSALVPTIAITGKSVSPASGVAQAFTSGAGKTYTVTQVKTSGGGTTKNYTVTVTVAPSPLKDITAFSFTAAANSGKLIDDVAGTINGATITVTLPPLTNVTALAATFTTTGATVKVGSTTQISGTTQNNFTNPVTYRVTAADGSTKDYTVTVLLETEAFTWSQKTSSGILQWYAMGASADGIKLSAAAYNNYIYTSIDGGTTWTARTNSGKREWYSLTSSADGMKLAAGVKSGYIYTSADGGATWTERTGAGSHAWYSITSSTDGMKIAAGDYSTGYIYTSTDGGATWAQRTASGKRLWSSIASSADGMKLFACVQNGYLYTSTDGGATWAENTSMGAQYWWSVTSSADGQQLAVIAYNGNLCMSHNGGATWTNLGNRGWCAISASYDGTKMAAVVDGGYIYLSTDSGVTWIQQTSAGIHSWDTVAVSGDGSMAVIGDYANYNGGYIWTGAFAQH